jgi:hypothetical protein
MIIFGLVVIEYVLDHPRNFHGNVAFILMHCLSLFSSSHFLTSILFIFDTNSEIVAGFNMVGNEASHSPPSPKASLVSIAPIIGVQP